MRDHRGRLPKMRRASISVQKVGRGQPRSLRCDGYAAHAPRVDKFSSLALGVFGVAVDAERSLTASPIARVETDDHPDLPDSERSLPERSSAAASIASQQASYPYRSSSSLQL